MVFDRSALKILGQALDGAREKLVLRLWLVAAASPSEEGTPLGCATVDLYTMLEYSCHIVRQEQDLLWVAGVAEMIPGATAAYAATAVVDVKGHALLACCE